MKLRFNFLAIETFGRLQRTKEFVQLLHNALPTESLRETEDLKLFAESEGWDFGDYQVEKQLLDERLNHWMPRLAAYSCIILLYSIVESQLQECAEQVGKTHKTSFCVQDLCGADVEKAALYLRRVAGVDVKKDAGWLHIENLRQLRNLIVHAGGKPVKEKHQSLIAKLSKSHPGYVKYEESCWPPHGQVWISMNLCSYFEDQITEFFKRLFKELGLSEKGTEFA